jgi:ornithine carbamoyltransferase
MLFEKHSTRTRVSFEAGIFLLGGGALFLAPQQTHLDRGEPLEDTARVLGRYLNGLVVRTHGHDRIETLAQWSGLPVINALTDRNHPCQLLADLLTVQELRGSLEGLVAAWIGDGNNMAYSWVAAARQLGFSLRLACPKGYEPDGELLDSALKAGADIVLTTDPREAARGAQVINTDAWASMGQEEEKEARQKAFAGYQVNTGLLRAAAPQAIVLHCLPAYRGQEITDEVIEGPFSAVFQQAENRMYVQMAVLEALAGAGGRC